MHRFEYDGPVDKQMMPITAPKSRWGVQNGQEELSLLNKKDQQIRRLKTELENERRRADNAIKVLETYKKSTNLEQENHRQFSSEVSLRLKLEQETKNLKKENIELKDALRTHILSLENFRQSTRQQKQC